MLDAQISPLSNSIRVQRIPVDMPDRASGGGTGSKFTTATIIVCGVASLVASLLSFVCVRPVPSPGLGNLL